MLLVGLAMGGPWRTVETEHFRLHYPVEAEAWALDCSVQSVSYTHLTLPTICSV